MHSAPTPLLEARGIGVSFSGLRAVSDVSLSVAEREIVGLIGPNGAGKTTLFGLLSGFIRPDRGSIWLDGRRIDGATPEAICRRGLTRTFQIAELFRSLTVREVLTTAALSQAGLRRARAFAEHVAEQVGLGRKLDVLCDGLTLPDQKALEVAKALATRPRVILLDEVMAGLRPAECRSMADRILGLRASGLTFVVTEHNMAAIMALSDRLVVMAAGEKIAEGPPELTARNPEVIRSYMGMMTADAANL